MSSLATAPGHQNENHKGHKHEQKRKMMLEKFDKNKDGKLDDAEKAEMKKWKEERRQEMLKKFDKDGDGKLSDEEKAAMKAEMKKKHGDS